MGISLGFNFSFAQSPKEVDISAYLVNSENKELQNGEYEIRFALYGSDRAVADPYPSSSDARAWEEVQKIKIQDGFLNAYLGAVNPIPDNINFSKNSYYLGIRIGMDSEMFPRKRIGAVPMAVESFSVQGSVPGSSAGNLVLLGSNGKVDIKQLPTGTAANAKTLVLGNDKRLVQEELSVSGGYNYLDISNHEIILNQIDLASDITGKLDIQNGGTGLNSFTKGDVTYYNSGSSLSKLEVGNAGQVLTVSGGLPVWSDAQLNLYTASGTLLELSGNNFSLKEGILTDGKMCSYSLADGLVCNLEPSGVAYTAGNGLTLDTAEFKLGGTLSEFTEIALNSNDFVFSGTGNVGIGTTAPGQVLDIVGGSIKTDSQFISALAIGTAPMQVTSTTLVSNLNVDYLDGNHASDFAAVGHDHAATYEPIVSAGTTNYVWGMNAAGNAKEWKQLIEGDNITITHATNSITIEAADTGITYTAAGTLLDLAGTEFSVNEGTLTDGKICTYSSGTGLVCDTSPEDISTPYTAGSGLTLDFFEFKLGGTLSEFTDIALNSNDFVFSGIGNVGIGTTDPTRLLDINGAMHIATSGVPGTPTVGDIYSDGGNIYFYNGSGWDDLTDTGAGTSQWDNVAGGINYAGGSVGIGTTSPTAYLEIKAGSEAVGTAPLKFTAGTNLTAAENGAMEFDGAHLYITAGGSRYQLDQQGGSTVYTAGNGLTLDTAEFKLGGTLSEFTNIDLNSNNFIFSGSGNVGIGTTDPKGMLDVSGKLVVLSGGNIGIDTASSTRIIGIGGDSSRNIGMERGTILETVGYDLTINAGGATLGSSDKNGGDLYLSSGVSTGKGLSNIYLQTSPASASGKIKTIASAPTLQGIGYTIGNILTITTNGIGGQVRVATVDESGRVLTLDTTPVVVGSGYVIGTGKATTGGTGSGCSVNVTAITETADNTLTASVSILGTGKVGFGTSNPQAAIDVLSTIEQLRLSYDSSNHFSFAVNSTGDLTMTPSGGTGGIRVIGVDSDEPIIIGGMASNTATAPGAFIGNGTGNGITGTESFIGSGNWNVISGKYSFIGAGSSNTVTGDESYVGGGNSNTVSGTYSYIGGGWNNQVSGWSSAVFGGNANVVSGSYAAVIGGLENLAGANYTVVAGRKARTTNQGVFVFSDSQNANFDVNSNDTMGMRFAGGYWITGGNVGIGNTAPLQKLSVSGDASFTGDAFAQSGMYGVPGTDVTGISNSWLGAKWTNIAQNGLALKGPAGQTADYLQISSSSGTADVFVVDSSGRVGIGVTNPTAKINLSAGTASAGMAPLKFTSGVVLANLENGAMEYNGTHLYFTIGSYRHQIDQQAGTVYTEGNDVDFSGSQINIEPQLDYVTTINQTSANLTLKTTTSGNIILNPAGRVGIGTTSPVDLLDVKVGTNEHVVMRDLSGITQILGMNDAGNAYVPLAVDASVLMLNGNSTGNVGIGTTDPGQKLDVAGDVRTTGCIYYNGGTLGSCASDERLKMNISLLDFDNAIGQIMSLEPKTFNYKNDPSRQYSGLIAQEVEQVAPELVTIGANGYKQVKYGDIQWLTLTAVQQLASSANEQQSKITSLDSLSQNNISDVDNLNLQISEKYSILTGQISTLEERIKNDPYQMQIAGMETKMKTLEDKIKVLEDPDSEEIAVINNVTRNIIFQSFSEDNSAANVSTNLTNSTVDINGFGGEYGTPDIYNEIRIVNQGVDIYSNNLVSEYLEVPIYIEDTSSIIDIVAELGNQMDANEIQWNKDSFGNLISGWNIVRFNVKEGIKIGEIDWTHLNYMRVYFKFSGANKVKIGNVKIEITETITKVASSGSDSPETLTSQIGMQLSELQFMNEKLQGQITDIKAQSDANSKLLLAMDPKTMVYKDAMGSVDLLKGKLEAQGIVAGAFTVKNVDDSPKTIGEAVIEKIEKDENNDGIDDVKVDDSGEKTIDGKNVLVKTKAVTETAKIFTSFESNPNAHSWVDKIKDADGNYIGFKIMTDNSAENDVKVNWWIVESR